MPRRCWQWSASRGSCGRYGDRAGLRVVGPRVRGALHHPSQGGWALQGGCVLYLRGAPRGCRGEAQKDGPQTIMSKRALVLEAMVESGQLAASEAIVTMPVVIDDVMEYVYRLNQLEGSKVIGQVIRPPYGPTWLEAPWRDTASSRLAFRCTGASASEVRRAAMLWRQRRGFDGKLVGGSHAGAVHGVLVELFIWKHDRIPTLSAAWILWADESWRLIEYVRIGILPNHDGDMVGAMIVAAHALAFFHVKNCQVVEATNRADRRQAALRGRVGIVVRELVIAPSPVPPADEAMGGAESRAAASTALMSWPL